jgi:hypothetical protein
MTPVAYRGSGGCTGASFSETRTPSFAISSSVMFSGNSKMRPSATALFGGPWMDSRRCSSCLLLQVFSSPVAVRVAGVGVLAHLVEEKDLIAFSV